MELMKHKPNDNKCKQRLQHMPCAYVVCKLLSHVQFTIFNCHNEVNQIIDGFFCLFFFFFFFLVNFSKMDLPFMYFDADAGVLSEVFVGHSNAVWGLAYDGTKNNLVSCAADGTVRLWSPQNKSPLLNTYTADTGKLECNECRYEIII